MIKIYFKEKIDDEQTVMFYDADEAELREDYLILTANREDEEDAIAPIEIVGMFRADYVLGWSKE